MAPPQDQNDSLISDSQPKLKSRYPRYFYHNVNHRCDDLTAILMSVEVDMFYEGKREVLTSTTQALMKALGLRIVDLKVHAQVLTFTFCITDGTN